MKWLVLALLLAWAYTLVLLFRQRRTSERKVRFMLDAISSGDYAFKFSANDKNYRSLGINASLNRIADILREARDEAIEREKYYELIINQVTTGIIVVDSRGNIVQSNHEARRLLGLDVLTHTKQLSRIDDTLEKKVEELVPGEKTTASIDNERGTTELQLRASAVRLHDHEVRIIAINDIRGELDDRQQESWDKLIRVLTHEIMNTVTPIASLSETLLDRADNPETRAGLEVINRTSSDLLSFVNAYRQLTHIPTPHPRPFYVKPFAERMRQIALEQAPTSNITIEVDVEPRDLLVYADEGLIGHVVTNLLKNAVQAIGSNPGHVWMRAYTGEQEAVVIDITNDGPLIPREVAAQIFVPFFTTKADGSGIGLSLSRQVMKVSGGTLTLRSDPKRHLTTFTLTFL